MKKEELKAEMDESRQELQDISKRLAELVRNVSMVANISERMINESVALHKEWLVSAERQMNTAKAYNDFR